MRPLVQHHTPADFHLPIRVGPDHEVVVVPGVDHPQRADSSLAYERAHLADGWVEALGVAAQQLHAAALGDLVHLLRVRHCQRHGLLDDHVFPALQGQDGVLSVQLVRSGHVDGVHARAGTQLLNAAERLAFVFRLETI